MEPLFLAVICGCNAGFFREALHEVYIPRIQRGNTSYAGNVLGARGALLSILVHFFSHASWESLVETGVGEQSLSADDQLFVLTEATVYLTALRGSEAEALVERSGERSWLAELHRLRGVFLSAMGADETEVEASICAAIRTANEQKSISLRKRAEATYAEYRRQKEIASGGHGFRLPLW